MNRSNNRFTAPLTSSHWGTYRAQKDAGGRLSLAPFEDDPDPSPIGPGMLEVRDGPLRITGPAIRRSWLEKGAGSAGARRGSEPFVQVSWDEAEQLIAGELNRVKRDFGNEAIFGGSYGWASAGRFHHAQSQLKRFLNLAGGYTSAVNTYSYAAAEVMIPHVLGSFRDHLYRSTAWSHIIGNTRLFVAFGGVPLKNGQIAQGGGGRHIQRISLRAAVDAGVKFVDIAPLSSSFARETGAKWIAPRPCTDTALILGLCTELVRRNLLDRPFLETYTYGYDRFEDYLTGATDGVVKSAEWAAELCGIAAEDIRDLARDMAGQRTMISVSWSLTRQQYGEYPFWAAIALAAMLGQIGLPGGGICFGYSAVNSVGNGLGPLPRAAFPQGTNPVGSFIPVARIADMLLNPGGKFQYDGKPYTYPDIRLIWWAGGNPFHHHQDLWRLKRAWAKPDTVIVNDWCWNASAKHADIVLPCTTTVERRDLALTPRDDHLVSMSPLARPVGLAKDDHDIFLSIAERMGFAQDFSAGRSPEDWQALLYDDTRIAFKLHGVDIPAYEDFLERGYFRLKNPQPDAVMLADFRANPLKSSLNTPSGRIEIFSDVVAGYNLPDFPGHPFWVPPSEWLGRAETSELHLITHQPSGKLHSQLDHAPLSRNRKLNGREVVKMNPEDAQARGIQDGDMVRIHTPRGACLASAKRTRNVRKGVLIMETGAWFDPAPDRDTPGICLHGNPNAVTRDLPTSALAQGPAANTCLVRIEKTAQSFPDRAAFKPPEIIEYRRCSEKNDVAD